jgi:transposase
MTVERLDHRRDRSRDLPRDRTGGVSGDAGRTESAAGQLRNGDGGDDLDWLGVSNRRLYLVWQFFASKPVEHRLGVCITAPGLHDDCLGRTLDGLYAHDPTARCASIGRQAHERFGSAARQVHVDTTSFAVSGEDAADLDAHTIAVTSGYSRDHRADLKQGMLALATTRQGDVPRFMPALEGTASDQTLLVAAVAALATPLRGSGEEAPIFVADSGLYSAQTVARLGRAGMRWMSRVPETATEARAARALAEHPDAWQQAGEPFWVAAAAPAGQRGVVVHTTPGEERARATLARHAETTHQAWEQQRWHRGNRRCACGAAAQVALAQQLKRRPDWLEVQSRVVVQHQHRRPGRPRAGAPPDRQEWHCEATLTLNDEALVRAGRRKACFLVATTLLDPEQLSDRELIQTDNDQGSVERGFAFLKDPLFLAASVFVNKLERMVALSLVVVLCLLVSRLAAHRLRERLVATTQTVPNQLKQPTDRPTMRWMFQCFEGIHLVGFQPPLGPRQRDIAGLEPLHEQVLALLVLRSSKAVDEAATKRALWWGWTALRCWAVTSSKVQASARTL